MKYVLVTDMDDVLNNLLDTWIEILNLRYDTHVVRRDIKNWDMSRAFPSLTHEQLYSVLKEDDFWEAVEPKYDAIYYLKKIKDLGVKVIVATAASYSTIKTKVENNLLPHFDYLTYEDIVMIHDKSLLKCTWIIDDYHENIKNSDGIRILFDAPYNRDDSIIQNSYTYYDHRVWEWKEIYEIVKKKIKEEEICTE